jgi:hypothetical protein
MPKKTHGLSKHRLHIRWQTTKQRCYNQNHEHYNYYGGRGIKVCDEWLNNFKSFYDWAILNGYKDNLQLNRIDNNDDYKPSNCNWVTAKENSNNKRNNYNLTLNGKTQTLKEWADEIGINQSSLRERIERNNNIFDKTCIRKKYDSII